MWQKITETQGIIYRGSEGVNNWTTGEEMRLVKEKSRSRTNRNQQRLGLPK